jgi:hypothetical protein
MLSKDNFKPIITFKCVMLLFPELTLSIESFFLKHDKILSKKLKQKYLYWPKLGRFSYYWKLYVEAITVKDVTRKYHQKTI